MADMCLGTVQFGMKYGVNNTLGQPTHEQSFEMLNTAVEHGVNTIDTARAYGEAEVILGEYFSSINPSAKSRVKVISKLRPNCVNEDDNAYDVVMAECESSLERIHIEKLDGYLLHTSEYIYREDILKALSELKKQGIVDNIGVSIYDIKEGDAAIRTGIVDYIQLPFSVLDQRGSKSDFIRRAKSSGIKIFTRSAFLQGLFMMEKERIPEHLHKAFPYLDVFNNAIEKYEVDKVTALLQFVKQEEGIDYLVWGVDTKQQLEEDIDKFNNGFVPKKLITELKEKIGHVEEGIIFPSLWSNGKKAE